MSYHILFNEPQDVYVAEPIITEECVLEVAETIATKELELDVSFDTTEEAVSFLEEQHYALIPIKSNEMNLFMDYVRSRKEPTLMLTPEQTRYIYKKIENEAS